MTQNLPGGWLVKSMPGKRGCGMPFYLESFWEETSGKAFWCIHNNTLTIIIIKLLASLKASFFKIVNTKHVQNKSSGIIYIICILFGNIKVHGKFTSFLMYGVLGNKASYILYLGNRLKWTFSLTFQQLCPQKTSKLWIQYITSRTAWIWNAHSISQTDT